jgi:hypothetical protein
MIDELKKLERDKDGLMAQLQQIQGALQYVMGRMKEIEDEEKDNGGVSGS